MPEPKTTNGDMQLYRIKPLERGNYVKTIVGVFEMFFVDEKCPDPVERNKWRMNIWDGTSGLFEPIEKFSSNLYATEEEMFAAAQKEYRRRMERDLLPMRMK